MKISILLPYKENFSENKAGAVSLYVSVVSKKSRFKKNIKIYGETKDKILKREDIVEPEEEVVEVIKEDKTSENKKRNPLRGGVKT